MSEQEEVIPVFPLTEISTCAITHAEVVVLQFKYIATPFDTNEQAQESKRYAMSVNQVHVLIEQLNNQLQKFNATDSLNVYEIKH